MAVRRPTLRIAAEGMRQHVSCWITGVLQGAELEGSWGSTWFSWAGPAKGVSS